MRHCQTCKRTLPDGMFRKQGGGRGRQRWSSRCVECDRARAAAFREETKAVVEDIRKKAKDRGCCVCGERRHAVLELHHVEQKSGDWSKYRHSVRRVKEEFGKCVVLCANCHLLAHAGEVDIPVDAPRAYQEEHHGLHQRQPEDKEGPRGPA